MATTTLGNKAVGSIIQLKENGKLVSFYVAKHNYENSLNGMGRTLVVRKDCYDTRQWHSSNVNAYASSAIDSWLNGTYKNLLDADIRGVIGTTKIKYTGGIPRFAGTPRVGLRPVRGGYDRAAAGRTDRPAAKAARTGAAAGDGACRPRTPGLQNGLRMRRPPAQAVMRGSTFSCAFLAAVVY